MYGISVARSQLVFTDLPANHPYAKDILTAAAVGIINGDDTTHTVRPDAPVNRAESSKILNLLSQNLSQRDAALIFRPSSGTTPTKNVTLEAGCRRRHAYGTDADPACPLGLALERLFTLDRTEGQQMEVLEIVHKMGTSTSDGRRLRGRTM